MEHPKVWMFHKLYTSANKRYETFNFDFERKINNAMVEAGNISSLTRACTANAFFTRFA